MAFPKEEKVGCDKRSKALLTKRGWERTQEDLKQEQDSIEEVANRSCWKKAIEKGDLAIWQKPINHIDCVKSRSIYKTPHICKGDNADSAWYKDMEMCITLLPEVSSSDEVAGGELENWPDRAFAIPPRIRSGSLSGITPDKFNEDNDLPNSYPIFISVFY